MINFVATATLAIGLLAAAPKAPQWETSYGKALEETRSGQDPLLVVLDKPNSKSARLEPALLSEDKATTDSSKLLKPYRLCHVDVTTEYGQKVAKVFNAKEFPHVAIIDKTGSMVIFKRTGQIDSAEWEKILTNKINKSGERPSLSCPNCQRNKF
jgi:hypothetical protein